MRTLLGEGVEETLQYFFLTFSRRTFSIFLLVHSLLVDFRVIARSDQVLQIVSRVVQKFVVALFGCDRSLILFSFSFAHDKRSSPRHFLVKVDSLFLFPLVFGSVFSRLPREHALLLADSFALEDVLLVFTVFSHVL